MRGLRHWLQYWLRHCAGIVALLIVVSAVVFSLVNAIPGDAATIALGREATPELLTEYRAEHGLDGALPMRYLGWLAGVPGGDLGTSTMSGQAVAGLLAHSLPVTIELAVAALCLALAIGLPLGVAAARARGGLVDRLVSTLAVGGLSIPAFFVGTVLLMICAGWLQVLPAGGWEPWSAGVRAHLRTLLLPAVTLAIPLTAVVVRVTRRAVGEELQQLYPRSALAKGASDSRVVWRHTLPPALVSVATAVGIQAGYLLAGAVVVEEVFSLPGLGRLLLRAIGERDEPVILAGVMLIALGWALIGLLTDGLNRVLDPRVRSEPDA